MLSNNRLINCITHHHSSIVTTPDQRLGLKHTIESKIGDLISTILFNLDVKITNWL